MPPEPPPVAASGRDQAADRLETYRRVASRVGLVAIAVLLALGTALSLAGHALASLVLAAATTGLVAVPLIGIGTLLIEVVQKREWPFVRATLLIVLLIVYSVIQKLWAS